MKTYEYYRFFCCRCSASHCVPFELISEGKEAERCCPCCGEGIKVSLAPTGSLKSHQQFRVLRPDEPAFPFINDERYIWTEDSIKQH